MRMHQRPHPLRFGLSALLLASTTTLGCYSGKGGTQVDLDTAGTGTESTDSSQTSDTADAADGIDGAVDPTSPTCVATPALNALITAKCSPCHTNGAYSGSLNLDDVVASTVAVEAQEADALLVVPGHPERSYLYASVNGTSGGAPMPLAGPLTGEEQKVIADWIAALDCTPAGGTDSADLTDGTDDAGADSGEDGSDGTDGVEVGPFGVPVGCVLFKTFCNPVTNEGCTETGAACDLGPSEVPRGECFRPPNDQIEGAACDITTGPFCAAGLHCSSAASRCQRFCCSDDDCAGEPCAVLVPGKGSLGLCPVSG